MANVYPSVNGTVSVYPFGVDPLWYNTKNELTFMNSLKMKMAVSFGVAQMLLGLFLSLSNHLFFRDYLAVYFQFLPQLAFLMCTFGYMVFMIFYKWTVDWTMRSYDPPNLIQTMIAMFLQPGTIEPQNQLYEGQAGVQVFLLLVAFVSVPTMLLVKPLLENRRKKLGKLGGYAQIGGGPDSLDAFQPLTSSLTGLNGDRGSGSDTFGFEGSRSPPSSSSHSLALSLDLFELGGGGKSSPSLDGQSDSDENSSNSSRSRNKQGGSGSSSNSKETTSKIGVDHLPLASDEHVTGGGGHEDEPFGEKLIHSAIHTIEFVLGTVSNTASYLRLWALSLAHAQLAQVIDWLLTGLLSEKQINLER